MGKYKALLLTLKKWDGCDNGIYHKVEALEILLAEWYADWAKK